MNVFGVGPTEIFIVLIVILVLFGPDKLPELAKKIGGASREIRDNLNVLNEQMNNALETSMEADKARAVPPAGAPTTQAALPAGEPPSAPADSTVENRILPDSAGAPASPIVSEDISSSGSPGVPENAIVSAGTTASENSLVSGAQGAPDDPLTSVNPIMSRDSSTSASHILPEVSEQVPANSVVPEDSLSSENHTQPADNLAEMPVAPPPAQN